MTTPDQPCKETGSARLDALAEKHADAMMLGLPNDETDHLSHIIGFKNGYIQALKDFEPIVEALQSIAFLENPKACDSTFWFHYDNKDGLADTVAIDTNLAREALSLWAKIKGEGE